MNTTKHCERCDRFDESVYGEHWYNERTDREEVRHLCDACRTWLEEDALEWKKFYREHCEAMFL